MTCPADRIAEITIAGKKLKNMTVSDVKKLNQEKLKDYTAAMFLYSCLLMTKDRRETIK